MTRTPIALLLALPVLTFADERPPAPAEPVARPAAVAPAAGPTGAAPATALTVVDAKLGTAIADKEVTGVAESFPATVGKLYFWTKVTGGAGSEITHVWFRGDQKVSEVKLPLKFASVRTWSAKTIAPEAAGDWRVDVVAADGAVLKSVSFKVVE